MVTWYRHDIPKWMEGTEELPDREYRVYHMLCMLMYLNEGPIKNHERGIAGRCNMDIRRYRAGLKELVQSKKIAVSADGMLSNGKAAKELKNIFSNRVNAAKGGTMSPRCPADVPESKGTPARHQHDTSMTPGTDRATKPLKNHDQDQASLKGQTSLLREEKRIEDKKIITSVIIQKETNRISIDEEFDFDFWPIVVNQVGKRNARKAFHGARERAKLMPIITGLKAYQKNKPSTREWVNPATFLNEDRWEDSPADVEPRQKPGNGMAETIARVDKELGFTEPDHPGITIDLDASESSEDENKP